MYPIKRFAENIKKKYIQIIEAVVRIYPVVLLIKISISKRSCFAIAYPINRGNVVIKGSVARFILGIR